MITVTNRSAGNVTYNLAELRIRRVFTPGEVKQIPEEELNALFQMDGGATLIKDLLLVANKEWVESRWDAPVEYFWGKEDIERCLLKDSLELFEETLHYAPEGVLDLIKTLAWQLPLKDLNKINAIKEKLGFDVLKTIEIMAAKTEVAATPAKSTRLRKG